MLLIGKFDRLDDGSRCNLNETLRTYRSDGIIYCEFLTGPFVIVDNIT